MYEHKHKLVPGFTSKYSLTRLVYYEETNSVHEAIAREKQLKGWRRAKKIALIDTLNLEWEDLSAGWYTTGSDSGKATDASLRSA